MSFTTRAAVVTAAAALTGAAFLPQAGAADTTSAVPTSKVIETRDGSPKAISCEKGDVCFYNSSWQRCSWPVADINWSTGVLQCSWAKTRNVYYVWNNGTSNASGVAYYLNVNHKNRVGCTRQQKSGYLQNTYKVASHQWVSGSCG
ncbi:hypothetical protein GCM10010277_73660 [Streptomyces longisporoflavus]|uniref:hypothetical protein n=1 Tax=Streptomyces longisporoflavus TaxID=28044 RepID=UPI00167CBFF8|nr:hypothetical protein [Streptomyces longisporoflavus]GGV66075.1 hypothetical protein GCM10010277_73660 [Streptomyces longisporoflavus]